MIEGVVDDNLQARIPVDIADSDGNWHRIEAVIDTGFSAWLTLPPSIIAALRLTQIGGNEAYLGNGRLEKFDSYRAVVLWENEPVPIEVDSTDFMPLVGMSLLAGHELRIRVAEGDTVTVEALA